MQRQTRSSSPSAVEDSFPANHSIHTAKNPRAISSRSYAQVASSPPRKRFVSSSGSSVSSDDKLLAPSPPEWPAALPVKAAGVALRGARVPDIDRSQGVVTRSSHGIVKKRVLEDAASLSDQEEAIKASPTKKRRENVSRPHDESRSQKNISDSEWKTVARKVAKRNASKKSTLRAKKQKSADSSDYPSSDNTPPVTIRGRPRSSHISRQLFVSDEEVPNDAHYISSPLPLRLRDADEDIPFSISPLKLNSAKKVRSQPHSLLPAHEIAASVRRSPSPGSPSFLAAEQKEWDKEEARWRALIADEETNRRSTKGKVSLRGRRSPSIEWVDSPPPSKRTPSPSVKAKGKRRIRSDSVVRIEEKLHTSVPTSRHVTPKNRNGQQDLAKRDSSITPTKSKPASNNSKQLASSSFAKALAQKGIDLASLAQEVNMDDHRKGPEKYLADLQGYQVSSLPDVCEVNYPSIYDPLLADDYADLPNLVAGTFQSWSKAEGMGYFKFSGWAVQAPSLQLRPALSAIRFVRHRNFINPSRISPLDVHTVHTSLDGSRSQLHVDRRLAVCLSPLLVNESHLMTPTDRGLRNKFIKGTLHQQEMQRFVGLTCMAFGYGKILHAQIERDAMIFSTMAPRWSDSKTASSSNQSYIRAEGLFGKPKATVVGAPDRLRSFKPVLDTSDEVPVYDCRGRYFDFSNDLDNIEDWPRFEGEPPSGSFAVVAYTMATYKKGQEWNLSTNIQFVIVFAAA